ncbi:MAG: ATP-binding cassette domain-containing protein [Bacillota bacterium]|nr:ATP-binding cassette domain-containing protein [Bacillota bacterium]
MIHVENLTKSFKIYKKQPGLVGAVKGLFSNESIIKTAVNNMSFHINKGEIVGYIGSNGAGKSTTIKMMTGILTPTSGKCTVDGLIPYENRQKNAKNIGVVFGQRTQLWWDLPLTETFSILKDIYEVPDDKFKSRMKFLNDVLELSSFTQGTVRTLSLGQRMRADLAAALIHNPKVIYLDEPTVGLDVVVKENIRKAIKEINSEFKTTIILTTHDMSDIEELSDRVIIINNGEKIYDDKLKTLRQNYGYMRTIQIEVKNEQDAKKINVAKNFNLDEEQAKTWIEGQSLFISFNSTVIDAPTILSYVMSKIPISDMTIKEMQIEDIIKKIYRNDGDNISEEVS